MIKDKLGFFWNKRNDLEFSAVYTRAIFKNILLNLSDGPSHIGYFCHDNNYLFSLAALIESEDIHTAVPHYASRLLLVVSVDLESEEKVVKLYKDDKEMLIKNCGKSCPLGKFKPILEFIVESGGDLKEYCEVEA